MKAKPWFQQALSLASTKGFFHWELEFPEVFYEGAQEKEKPGFDVVVGNPPYGATLTTEEQEYIRKRFPNVEYRVESYVAFIETGLNLSREGGFSSLIVPDNWMYLDFTENLRSRLMTDGKLRLVVALPSNVFPDATVDTCIYVVSRKRADEDVSSHLVKVVPHKKDTIISSINEQNFFLQPQAFWISHHGKIINPYLLPHEAQVILKIDVDSHRLQDIATINYGLKAYQKGKGKPPQTAKIVSEKPFTTTHRLNSSFDPFYDGAVISRYQISWFDNSWIKWGPWLAEPRSIELFDRPRLLLRKVASERLIGTYETRKAFSNTLIYVIRLPENSMWNLRGLLAILNSTLMGFYFRKAFAIREDDVFPQILLDDVSQLPIHRVNFTPPFKERVRLLEKGEKLYDQCLAKGDQLCVMGFVEHCLAQKPKHADAVHDFLAFLADQMIEMNKKKQAEVKGFLEWLERNGHPFWPFWENVASWWDIRHLPNVLLLHFADLKRDLPGAIRRIAAFLEIPLSEGLLETVVRHSSFDYMKAHAAAPHMQAYGAKTKDLLASRVIHILSPAWPV